MAQTVINLTGEGGVVRAAAITMVTDISQWAEQLFNPLRSGTESWRVAQFLRKTVQQAKSYGMTSDFFLSSSDET